MKSIYRALRPTTLVEIANDLSSAIDAPWCSLERRVELYTQFEHVSHELRIHGGEEFLIQYVRCPWNIPGA